MADDEHTEWGGFVAASYTVVNKARPEARLSVFDRDRDPVDVRAAFFRLFQNEAPNLARHGPTRPVSLDLDLHSPDESSCAGRPLEDLVFDARWLPVDSPEEFEFADRDALLRFA